MKMRAKLKTSSKISLQAKYFWIIGGGVAVTAVVIFIASFGLNIFGVQKKSMAQTEKEKSSYPFNVSDKTLKEVNFTVLPSGINSKFPEVRPFITADGKSLFFCRRNHPDNFSKKKDNQDIWFSTLQGDDTWSEPKNLGVTINTENADAICSVSPDGSEIVFISDLINPKKPLMKSVRTDKGWGAPQSMEIENFYNRNRYIDFYYSFEANVLLMAIEREESRGEQDLYVSFPKGKNKWSEPKNLGPLVNSRLSDFAPFLSSDGKTLYFSSYGHKGFGGCDIFQTTRLDDTWQKWSEVKNLGEGINSPREESYFSVSGDYKHIYFESYDLKNEVRDVFRADVPQACKPSDILKEDPLVIVRQN